MTHQERTTIRAAINNAKRAWLEAQGGYRTVEQDARCMDQRLSGRGRGTHKGKRAAFLAGRTPDPVRQELRREQRKVKQLERRIENLEVALRLARQPKKTALTRSHLPTVDSRSTGHISSTA